MNSRNLFVQFWALTHRDDRVLTIPGSVGRSFNAIKLKTS